MPALWLKFPDEVLFCSRFSDENRKKLEQVFSVADRQSPWMQALEILRLKMPDDYDKLIYWYQGAPYFNWSCFAHVISGGAMSVQMTQDRSYNFSFSYRIKDVFALLVTQWKIARFLEHPPENMDKLVQSIALGVVLQALIMRLGSDSVHMAKWLALPAQAPKKYRKILEQIQAVQIQRTNISAVWNEVFSAPFEDHSEAESLIDFFWDDAIPEKEQKQVQESQEQGKSAWKGMSVCTGALTGLAIAIEPGYETKKLQDLKQKYNAPLILVFRNSRPETTEFFPYADAVLFATGGVLSHACTVAREMNIPSVTALGPGFAGYIFGSNENIWLQIDGSEATVECTSSE